jgi:formimidoylglutamate deiminase
MSMQSRYRFSCAWLPDGWHRNVVISVDPVGDIVDVSSDDVVTTARMINGIAIPGMPNAHSHAFQRALAGLAERRSGDTETFWSWRDVMYRLAGRLTPESLNAIAAQVYADMLKAGYTAVCEFHYLHNQPDGRAYDDALVMCHSLIDAAATAGIGLTLLPTLYQTSDFGGAEAVGVQKRFVMQTEDYLSMIGKMGPAPQHAAQIEVGIAFHSLRAVPLQSIKAVLDAHPDAKTIHIHIAEQEREVARCLEVLGQRPVECLLNAVAVDERWSLVHATHASGAELQAIAASGANVVLCPSTEANLGDGSFATSEYLRARGVFSIGSDSHIRLSPCEELRWLEYQARLANRQRSILATEAGQSIGAFLWRRTCEAGAQSSARRIGSLEAGCRADIVVLDASAPCFMGRVDDVLMDTFVFAAPANAVRDVMVGGRWLVQDGRHFAETAIAAGYRRALGKLV